MMVIIESFSLIPTLAGVVITLIPALLLHHREIKKMNLRLNEKKAELYRQTFACNTLERWLNIHYINELRKSARYIINKTQADRFLVIIGFNGKHRFRFISVIVEEHLNEQDFNSVERYKKIKVDDEYINMMHNAENHGPQVLNIQEMPECILKDFYLLEGVEHSVVRFLDRQIIDEENDLVIFGSVATHSKTPFDNLELSLIDAVYQGRIAEILKKIKAD